MNSNKEQIGIDLGGTKIEVIVLTQHNEILYRERLPTPQGKYLETLDVIAHLIENAELACNIQAQSIGIGIPGAISPATGLVKNANSTWLIGKHLNTDLEEKLGRPVVIANDADCFALSEAYDGSGAGYHSVFGVILGTGVGGGIIINGSPLSGPNAITGEWGHNSLPWLEESDLPGRKCYCGKENCIETFLSGPGFEKAYQEIYGKWLSSASIWSAASQGEQSALDHALLYIEQLAKALASVINILDPGVIVLGGGMSNQQMIYSELHTRMSKYAFSDQLNTPVKQAQHGDSSGVRGAAWLNQLLI